MLMLKKSILLKISVILISCILNFAVIIQNSQANTEEFLDAIVVTINDTALTLSDINKKYDKNFTYDDLKDNYQTSKIIDTAILDTIVEMEARKKRISVTDKELNSYISQIAQRNSLSVSDFKEELKKQNISLKNYKEQIKSDILKSKIASSIVRNGAAVTDEEINNYLKRINENKLLNSKISLRQICVFKENKTEAEALQKLKSIKDALNEDDFSDVAKKYSESQDSINGGMLGEFELNELSSEIFSAISQLNENDVSKIVETKNAYYIFQVAKKDVNHEPTEQEVKLARQQLEEEHLKDAIDNYFSKEIFKNYSVEKKI